MIHVYNGSKFKKDHKCKSSADLISKYTLDYLDEAERLDKELSKGNHVYCWINPFQSEIHNRLVMFWSSIENTAKDDYWQANEEI